MPWAGRLRDARVDRTTVSALMVSPARTGAGNDTASNPRFATIVPCVSCADREPHDQARG